MKCFSFIGKQRENNNRMRSLSILFCFLAVIAVVSAADPVTPKYSCEHTVAGGGWVLVRRVPAGDSYVHMYIIIYICVFLLIHFT